MFKVSKEELWKMHDLLFKQGLTGGGSVTPVQLEFNLKITTRVA